MCHIILRVCAFPGILACLMTTHGPVAQTHTAVGISVETLMVGGLGSGHYAFTSQGRTVRPIGKNSCQGSRARGLPSTKNKQQGKRP